ncbi:DUF58 domain-containing protein [Anaerolineales bacterium]
MVSPALLKQIRQIEIKTRRAVTSQFNGVYRSAFKGSGLSFQGLRPYEAGDDIRRIDWQTSARLNNPYIKEYVEERQLNVMLAFDISASTAFGSTQLKKREIAAELGSIIAYTCQMNHDRVGAIFFTDKIEAYIPPKQGRKHIQELIYTILSIEATSQGTDFTSFIQHLHYGLKQGASLFLFSDFFIDFEKNQLALSVLSRRHEISAIILEDPVESQFPDIGIVQLKDAENQDQRWYDTGSEKWRDSLQTQYQILAAERASFLRACRIPSINVASENNHYIALLVDLFQRRMQI